MTDSGSSSGGGTSDSRHFDPSGDPCIELSFVLSCVRGDITGDSCWELEVNDDGLAADVGADVYDGMVGRMSVVT